MIVDCITYNGEAELFDLRYHILKDYVDEFIVVEFDKTFSGKAKPWYFNKIADNYKYRDLGQWQSKVTPFFVYEKDYDKYQELAESSPNTQGADHWKREFCQKESIKDCLTHLKDDDIVFIGDCDEIWNPKILQKVKPIIAIKLHLLVYTYYLNNCSDEQFWGTLFTYYKNIKDKVLNHQRTTFEITNDFYGWHFTSMGGYEKVKQKLEDSYTEETYANDMVMKNLKNNMREGIDFLGRNFKYLLDESEWPEYLKDNREKYRHLLGRRSRFGQLFLKENGECEKIIEKPLLPL